MQLESDPPDESRGTPLDSPRLGSGLGSIRKSSSRKVAPEPVVAMHLLCWPSDRMTFLLDNGPLERVSTSFALLL